VQFRIKSLLVLACFFFSGSLLANQKLSISPETFGQLENILNISLSPTGKRVATLRNLKGQISLITRSLDPAEKGQVFISTFEQGEFKRVHWLSDERLLFSLRFPSTRYGSKAMESRLVAMDWNKKNMVNLVKRQKRSRRYEAAGFVSQIQDSIVSYLPNDPDHILLELDNEDINHPDVYKINVHTGARKRIVKTRADVVSWYADKNGVVRLGHGKYKSKDRIIFRESEEESWKTIARYDVIDNHIPFGFAGFSPDPGLIYVSKLSEAGLATYYIYNPEQKKFSSIIDGDTVDVIDIELDEDESIRSYSYFDDSVKTVYKDKLWRDLNKMLDSNFPDQNAEIVNYSQNQKKFIISVSSPTNPGDFYLLDLNKKKLDWYAETYPGLDIEKLSTMKSVTYKARDDLEIPSYLSLPKGVKDTPKLPTVILPHGGPFARDSYGFDYWVQFLTTRGYAVLQMNYRGSKGYGAAYENKGNNEWGGKMLDDINDGAYWMIEQGYSNPDRICIMGGSYGGYAALQSLVKEPDLYKCSVALAPVTNMSTFFNQLRDLMYTSERYLPYINNKEGSLEDISPYHQVDKINVPVLLVHGTNDRKVHYKQSEMFADRMKQKNKEITFISLEQGDHHLSRQKHRSMFLDAVEKFLNDNL